MGNFLHSRLYQDYLSVFSTTVKTILRNSKNVKFEPEVMILDKIVDPGSICLDIGAAYGRYALPLSRIVGRAGRVYSFEPGRYSYRVLTAIKKFYGLNNVIVTKKALSDKEKQIKLFSPIKRSGKVGPSLAYIDEKENSDALCEVVSMTTIDVFCSQENIKRVDFIKCDIEGAELLAYQGGVGVIERDKPVVMSEVDEKSLNRYGQSVKDLEDFFFSKGYKLAVFEDGNLKGIGHFQGSRNYFFIHGSRWEKIIKKF
ncbi:MAG TPA: FkbM family methyltransferase [Candidatus Omnitrophota bacterium]|nr:FkbM family methyltransferase [Candidatus Omnitrophota bacterium]